MIRFIIFSGLFTSLGISQVDIFDSFLRFIHQDSGIRMNINFYQTQFGETYTTAGMFYYLQDGYYVYDSQKQRIIVNGDTITTINKHANQIIYDLSIPSSVNIFDILTGNMEGIKREPAILEKSGYRILFTIPDWELSGVLRLNSGLGQPTDLELSAGDGHNIRIQIISSEKLSENSIPDYETTHFDVIDLRE